MGSDGTALPEPTALPPAEEQQLAHDTTVHVSLGDSLLLPCEVDAWGKVGHLNDVQTAALVAFRAKVPLAADEEADCFNKSSQLLRFLRARAFSVPKALAAKHASDAWWAAERPRFHTPRTELVAEQLLGRRLITWAPGTVSLVVVSVGAFAPRDRGAALAALLLCLDAAVAAAPSRELAVVFDLRDYSSANQDLGTAARMVNALNTAYVERLAKAVFLGAPAAFALVWKVVKAILSARTARKVVFCPGLAELHAQLAMEALPPGLGGHYQGTEAHMAAFCASLQAM